MREITFKLLLPLVILAVGGCTIFEESGVLHSPAAPNSQLPFLTTGLSGNLHMSWIEQSADDTVTLLKTASLHDGSWSPAKTIASGSNWFVNWADYPSIVAGDQGLRAAHWLHKTPGGTYSYEIKVMVLNGRRDTVLTPHFDQTATEHGFVSMIPWEENSILGIWLDGRETADRAEDEYGDISRAMTLRSAVITSDGKVRDQRMVDGSVCDCCQTSLAATSSGAVAAYRNRTDEEVRDIYVSRYENGSWSDPVTVYNDNWIIGGCPVNGPVVETAGDTVLVAWFTGAGGENQVKAAVSFDEGKSFNEPITIDDKNPMGRVDAVVDSEGHAAVSWIAQSGDGANLKVRALNIVSGSAFSPFTVTPISPDRKSGFPQMELLEDELVFSWTSLGDQTQVELTSISMDLVVGN